MAIKQISLKGLAEFMTAGPAKQRTILGNHKYPKDDESRAMIMYYREVREAVMQFHRERRDFAWLQSESKALLDLSLQSVKSGTKTRLKNNARALADYAKYFGRGPHYEVLPELRWSMQFSDVVVSVVPDMHIRRDGREMVLKLEFSSKAPSDDMVRIISQGLYEAAFKAGLRLDSGSVLYVDVPRGREHKGARVGSRLRHDISAACENFSAMWDRVLPRQPLAQKLPSSNAPFRGA